MSLNINEEHLANVLIAKGDIPIKKGELQKYNKYQRFLNIQLKRTYGKIHGMVMK